MKRIILIICLLPLFLITKAQPAAVKGVMGSLLSVTTYAADGKQLSVAPAVFIGPGATVVSAWTPFEGADSVVVSDNSGTVSAFEALLGADEIYDIVKFSVSAAHPQPITLGTAAAGDEVWIVPPKVLGSPVKGKVKAADHFNTSYNYYQLQSSAATAKLNGAAVVNLKGELIGIFNLSENLQSATDAAFARDFTLKGLSQNDPVMRRAHLRIGLPDNEREAIVALLLSNAQKPRDHEATIREFIRRFPYLTDGYYALTMTALGRGDNAEADRLLQEAVDKATKKGEAHFNYGNVIYLVLTNQQAVSGNVPATWTLDKALEEARLANAADPQFIYQHLIAQITYAKGSYSDALSLFENLAKAEPRLPETYLEMAQCKEHLGATDAEVLALLEQSVAVCDTPYIASAAPYFYARGFQYAKVGEYRKAMVDLLRYEYFNQGQLDAGFYYQREQIELKGKLFQQALGDILTACRLAPDEVAYHAEAGSLYLRVNRFEDAAEAGRYCIKTQPDYADGYLILGIAQVQLGQKADGLANIEKAKALGNAQADSFLKKLK